DRVTCVQVVSDIAQLLERPEAVDGGYHQDHRDGHHGQREPLRELQPSSPLTTLQRSSSASSGASPTTTPRSAVSSSRRPNRRTNFWFARIRAVDGCTLDRRAKLTTAKSRSPVSSSRAPASY